MADYDFSTLSSSDFEKLVCDLLNAHHPASSGAYYRLFKDGKDKGIDFLHATPNAPYAEVGQAKHYYRTGFPGLLAHLRDPEKDKVVKLNPGKYILATSVDLSVGQVQQIATLLSPYIKNSSDVYGKANLNQLFDGKDQVLLKHFKLWFSDSAVLRKLLSAEMYYRTAEFVEHELTKRMRLFVSTPVLDIARQCLEEHHFVIITGEPGVGKSTLAEMLVYEKLKEDYAFLYVHDKIDEVEKFFEPNDSKQLIYFDDFLGSNSEEVNRVQGSESALVSILRKVKRNPNKRLIFTTRVHILNSVVDQSEKLDRFRILDGETQFNLGEYNRETKEQLLQNHVDESELADDLKAVLKQPSIIDYIVSHRGFSPRSVEYITTKANVKATTPDAYRVFIKENFDNPTRIWRNAYRREIGDVERWLLNTLVTFDGPVELAILEEAFNQRLDKEPAQAINAFQTALVRLDRGFISVKSKKVDFANPSIKDFLINFLSTDRQEINRILNAMRFIQQYSPTTIKMAAKQDLRIPQTLQEDMMVNYLNYTRPGYHDHDLIRLATFIQNHLQHQDKDDYLIDIIESINEWGALYQDYTINLAFTQFLDSTRLNYKVQNALKERTTEIVDDLVLGERDVFKAVSQLEQLAQQFQLEFNNYDTTRIFKHLDELFDDHISNEVDLLEDYATDPYEVSEKFDEVKKLAERLDLLGLEYEVDVDQFENKDWDEITRDNDFRRLMEKDD